MEGSGGSWHQQQKQHQPGHQHTGTSCVYQTHTHNSRSGPCSGYVAVAQTEISMAIRRPDALGWRVDTTILTAVVVEREDKDTIRLNELPIKRKSVCS